MSNNETTVTTDTQSKNYGWYSAIHFYVWLAFGLIVYFSDQLDRFFRLWLLLIPVLAIPAFIALGTTLVGLVANLWTRRWKRLISVFAAPLVTIGLFKASLHYQIDADWVRFQFTRTYYVHQLRHLPGPSPMYREWYWGETGGAGVANIIYRLVYDETDKPLELPVERNYDGAQATVRPYGQHFFLVTEVYP